MKHKYKAMSASEVRAMVVMLKKSIKVTREKRMTQKEYDHWMKKDWFDHKSDSSLDDIHDRDDCYYNGKFDTRERVNKALDDLFGVV